ncbi:cupin domain-containing protein [Deminuibacter soli]|uniref:Cupin domain-containing protein n=1 Tax=Deminuibacter soli TaxID=2291815 RepID=A0A3E1NI31_9BACT|nr:cupin domain-containing protein [Deminuibacter soli]RFM27595.1 cupin domain-containing protein [Deminuibacter soli]
MKEIWVNEVPVKETVPGYKGRFIHTANMTFAYWDVEAGSVSPEHTHPQEQVAKVLEGSFELTIDGETVVLEPGKIVVIPPHVKHGGKAITDCKLLDVFYPVREDYRSL